MHLIVQNDRPTVRTNVGRDIVRLPAVILSPELPYENKKLWISHHFGNHTIKLQNWWEVFKYAKQKVRINEWR